jgi:hypothetical protein
MIVGVKGEMNYDCLISKMLFLDNKFSGIVSAKPGEGMLTRWEPLSVPRAWPAEWGQKPS